MEVAAFNHLSYSYLFPAAHQNSLNPTFTLPTSQALFFFFFERETKITLLVNVLLEEIKVEESRYLIIRTEAEEIQLEVPAAGAGGCLRDFGGVRERST